jgi:outer membrane protein assembly factor BamB
VRRWIILGVALVVLIAIGLVAAYVIHVRRESRDIRGSSTVEFTTTTTTTTVTPLVVSGPKEPGIEWQMYGHDPERLRVATGVSLAPPYKKDWTFHAQSLIEFPPALAYGRLYFATNAGVVDAISAKTGKRAWHYVSGRCQAMSPAVIGRTIYATFLNPPPCNANGTGQPGELVALWAGSGKVRWKKTIGPSESSPAIVNGDVFVGDWNGNVYCFSAATGRLWWKYSSGAKIKGGIAVSGNRVYFGTYDSKVYALTANKGKLVWTASAQPRLGHPGEFYATPAVAYGRVYIGATDGKEYSFGATDGHLIWSNSTGGYVYSSTAVWKERVFVGSYSGSFYSFNAATGDELWSFRADGRISGSPTIVGGRVYFATLSGTTYALDARTGRLDWTFPDGEYSPVIADAKHVYLTGKARVYGLSERRPG